MLSITRKTEMVWRLAPILVLCGSLAWSWGAEGHQIVARVAALNLNPNAASQVAQILGVPVTSLSDEMAFASTWADIIRFSHPETAAWHFVDIPRHQPSGKPSDFCPNDDCVSFRLADFASRLKSNTPGPAQWTRVEQLKFLIHFAGDLHQPLHCTTNSDRGGNCVKVTTFPQGNLHRVWDTDILVMIGAGDVALAQQFSARYLALPDASKQKIIAGTPDDWALAAHQLALSKSYGLVKPPIPVIHSQIDVQSCAQAPPAVLKLKVKLGPSYFTQTEPVVGDQLMRAGARLANILNTIWPAN